MFPNTQDVTTITGLSTELIDLLAQHLDKADLLSMRATCRKLRNDSAYQFCQRCLSKVDISGSSSSVRDSIDILHSPNLPHAQHLARSLTVRAMLTGKGWGIDLDHLRKHMEPDQRDIVGLLAAMPNLKHIALKQHFLQNHVTVLESPLLFFKSITASGSHFVHLRSLSLHGLRLDGDELASMLERQIPNLQSVAFRLLTLTGGTPTTTWTPIIKILSSMPLKRFLFYKLCVLDQDGKSKVLFFPMHVYTHAEAGIFRDFGAVKLLASHAGNFNLTPVKPALEKLLRAWGEDAA
jgi:hypothetical protein